MADGQKMQMDEGVTRPLSDLLPSSVSIPNHAKTIDVSGITADSREVKPGFIFAALKGVNLDGTRFVDQAIDAGAVAILVDETVTLDASVPVLAVENPRRELAQIAARLYPAQPEVIAAVTGTAGKTSVAAFLRQIWKHAGKQAASVGTVGVVSDVENIYGSLTTPDPVALHKTIDRLANAGVTHLAIEASSHGIDQYRLDGVNISTGGFTNLGRDHMDYHATVEEYFDAKMGLVERLLPEGADFVVEPESPFGAKAEERADASHLNVLSVGEKARAIELTQLEREGFAQKMTLKFGDETYDVLLPLVGRFQVSNALVAAGMAYSTGVAPKVIVEALQGLKGESGRLEYVGETSNGALVFIDYAHKVEALENVLEALRPYADNNLVCVFGCGGDRDHGKRALMGAISAKFADKTIVTDDNPRSEDPALVRAAIIEAVPDASEIGDREQAIFSAIADAESGDVIVIAGKGHETGQIIKDKTLPFSDHEVVARALNAQT
ncbi:MAG: UDP-N-acetylmuramoyl-L-alanyl-D-glutamate--2,6-diaminopimelate ligase [Hyphomicrobiales bacterium]